MRESGRIWKQKMVYDEKKKQLRHMNEWLKNGFAEKRWWTLALASLPLYFRCGVLNELKKTKFSCFTRTLYEV